MASRVGRVLQDRTNIVDSSSGASVGWKSGGLHGGRRTPLGDLSNSLKPSANRGAPSKVSFVKNENPAVTGKKKGQDGGARRKALSDISNSGKPPVNETRKNLNRKLSVVTEEPEDLDVSQEGFLHNHEECIKANAGAMNLNQFLKTLGLHHGPPKEMEIPRANSGGAKAEALDIPLLPEEPEEMQMETPSYSLASPPQSPLSPKLRFDFDGPNFELIESPKAIAFPVVW